MIQAVILAAGKGKRLHPVTTQRTKAMAPVAGKPMVERVLDALLANGVRDFTLIISPDDQEIIPHFQWRSIDAEIRFVVQQERLGMAHALRLATPHLGSHFVMSACDNLVPPAHIGEMLESHQRRNAHATLSLMEIDIALSASTGIIAWQDGWIQRIVEKPKPAEAPSNISSLPLYVFSPRLLDHLPRVQLSARGEYELQDAIQMLIEQDGQVTGVLTESRQQITNLADLLELNRAYLESDPIAPVVLSHEIGEGTQLIPPLRIDPGVRIGAGCCLGPHVTIESNCQIGANVQIAHSIVLRGATIPDGRQVHGEVLW